MICHLCRLPIQRDQNTAILIQAPQVLFEPIDFTDPDPQPNDPKYETKHSKVHEGCAKAHLKI